MSKRDRFERLNVTRHEPDFVPPWACPRCGSIGYVVAGILRCANVGCPDTREYDPATGDQA